MRSTETQSESRVSAQRSPRQTGCVGRSAAKVAADRHTHDHRARPVVARPVTHHGHFVAELHESRPDVVEKLNLDHRLQPAKGHPDAATDDVGFGER